MTILIFWAVAALLSYGLYNYRISVRQALVDQAKLIADSEMEYLYFQWKTKLLLKVTPTNLETVLTTYPSSSAPTVTYMPVDSNGNFTNPFTATLAPFSNSVDANVWKVGRVVKFTPVGGSSGNGSSVGMIPGTLQTGLNFYFKAYTKVVFSGNPFIGNIEYHSGRRFVFSNTSLFQFAIFYQGNLEVATGSTMTITGPIATNGTAYLASTSSASSLILASKLYYFQGYNPPEVDSTGGIILDSSHNPIPTLALQGDFSTYVPPVFNPDPTTTVTASQSVANAARQLVQVSSQTSFLGGIDIQSDLTTYPDAYKNTAGVVDANEVYRAVIAPPPITDTSGTASFVAEDPIVAARRMYYSSGLIITISQDTSGGTPAVHFGTAPDPSNPATITTNPSVYDALFANAQTSTGQTIVTAVRQAFTDKRESYTSGETANNIRGTYIDVGALNTVLHSLVPSGSFNGYNGMVYVYDKTNTTTVAPGTKNAIILTNAQTTPAFTDSNGNNLGFTVTTDNGLYVKGDYNTAAIDSSGTINPAALMADAVTVLSQGWQASSSALPFNQRHATASTDTNPSVTATGLTINSAILTGNTPSTTNNNSGGAQNLVRYLEDWWYPVDASNNPLNLAITLNGSIGQLFSSKYFTGGFVKSSAAVSAGLDPVYYQPHFRNVNYDSKLATKPPAGTPTTTSFTRGDFFNW